MPDNVDDIVADIAQEEKEEGQPALLYFLSSWYKSFRRSQSPAVTCSPLPVLLQTTRLRRASTPTGPRGPPAARPPATRASG